MPHGVDVWRFMLSYVRYPVLPDLKKTEVPTPAPILRVRTRAVTEPSVNLLYTSTTPQRCLYTCGPHTL